MKSRSVLFKISLALLLLVGVSIGFYLNNALSNAEEKSYADLAEKLILDLNDQEHLLENIGVTNATFIADNSRIKQALIQNDRSIAIKELKIIFDNYKKSTKIKDLKVHIHTTDVRSFVRSWKLDKFGDDLSGFRKTVIRVNTTHHPVFDFEVGRMGLTLRAIVPVMRGEDFLGTLEFIQSFDNAEKYFEKKGHKHLLLMNDSLVFIARDLKEAPSVDHYKLGSNIYNEDFLKAAQALDLDKLHEKGYLLTNQYLFTYKDIRDMSNNSVGMHLMGIPIQQVQTVVEVAKSSTLTMIIILISSIFIILLFLLFLLRGRG